MGNTDTKIPGLLAKIRRLLHDPKHWTQGTYARDARNKSVVYDHPDATCWCLYGAFYNVLGGDDAEGHPLDTIIKSITKLFPTRVPNNWTIDEVTAFNDHPNTTHKHVLAVLEHAIAQSPA